MHVDRIALWLKSSAVAARYLLEAATPSNSFDDWTTIHCANRVATAQTDIPVLLFNEVAKPHLCVAEIGASNGSRMLALKLAHPEIETYAFDIRPEYSDTPETVSGVHFIRHSQDIFKTIPEITLVCSVYTLTCLEPDALDRFLSEVKHQRAALCFFEPSPIVSIDRSIRRKRDSWHHPYQALAKRHGFQSQVSGERWKHFGNSKMAERTYYDHWT